MSQSYQKLKALLKELFQLDQPDLDFGFYRIMHAKAREISKFLDADLLPQIKAAFSDYADLDKAKLQRELDEKIQQLKRLDEEPEQNKQVLKLREQLQHAADVRQLEAETYDHLYSFFRRYYSEGDYLSKRVYKAGVYAIPYEGEEVKLHWANSDQYYIKTGEYLRDYAFRLRPDDSQKPMRVHFRLVDAAEGEHGNVKPNEGKERVFILAADNFIHEEQGELIISFAYRPATLHDKTDSVLKTESVSGQTKPPNQKELIAIAVQRILSVDDAELLAWIDPLNQPHVKVDGEQADYTRLEAHLRRYTARNTFDYFIHKDLGGFLRRELDFYIKNEIMHLDDVEHESFERVRQYLSKIKILRRIAGKIIEFLAQLEDFQKKLWLKKKFVIDTQYCITLDRIPEGFYPEIAANDAQREEWVKLFAIDEIKGDLATISYSIPITLEFLTANNKLILDTVFFDELFKNRLVASIDNFDEQCDGLLIHSENFQALNLLQQRYYEQIKCIYIDPPYNTDASEIIYKNGYKNSSWITMIKDRIDLSRNLMRNDGSFCATIDDFEFQRLRNLVDICFSRECIIGIAVIKNNPSGRSTAKGFSIAHEYGIFVGKSENVMIGRLSHSDNQKSRYKFNDELGAYEWVNFRKHGGANANRYARRKLFYPIFISEKSGVRFPSIEWKADKEEWLLCENTLGDEQIIYPINSEGEEKTWKWGHETAKAFPSEFAVRLDQEGKIGVYKKSRINEEGTLPLTVWDKKEYSSTEYGSNYLKRLFGASEIFSFPKSIHAVTDSLKVCNAIANTTILDYFAGSGTTGEATIILNREDQGNRKYILIEQGDYFYTVLKPRIQKVIYSADWKDGKATAPHTGISQAFKVLKIESYEDTLNNLALNRSEHQQSLFDLPEAQGTDGLKEQYLLRYMLDVETQGSQSLLNIAAFADPTAYQLKVKRPGSDESRLTPVDLVETFNYLIGLTVRHIAALQMFTAEFVRDGEGRLQLQNGLHPSHGGNAVESNRHSGMDRRNPDCMDASKPRHPWSLGSGGPCRNDEENLNACKNGPWWFRSVTGTLHDGTETLIVWRKLTGDVMQDNRVLDAWFMDQGHAEPDRPFNLVYVNGDNSLENLKPVGEVWKVRLIEEDFQRLMFDAEGV